MAPDGAAVAFTRARHSALFDASRVAAVKLNPISSYVTQNMNKNILNCSKVSKAISFCK